LSNKVTKNKEFRSINHKVFSYVTWCALTLLLFAAIASFFIQYTRSKINTVTMLNQLLDTVEETVTVAAYSKNRLIAKDIITGLLKNDIVHAVEITTKGGFSSKKAKSDDVRGKDQISRSIYSLFDKNEIIGFIKIQPSAQYSLTEAKYATISNILSSFFLIALTSLVILIVIRKYISRPLTFVSNTLHKIGSGKQQLIPLLQNNIDDELGQLRIDINNLLTKLEDRFNNEYGLRQKIESMEKSLRNIYNSSSAGLFLLDMNGKILTSNSTFMKILNLNESFESNKQHLFQNFFVEPHNAETLIQQAINSRRLESEDLMISRQNGSSPKWVHCLLSKISALDGKSNLEGVLFDVTNRVESEIANQYEATHDLLTKLLNKQAAQALFKSSLHNQQNCFLMMDLDGFKQANDTYGHIAGDQILKITADRLTQCVRSSDIICRFGGDEFLIILFDCQSQGLPSKIAEKVVTSIQKKIVLNNNNKVRIGVSVGIACFSPSKDNSFETMVKKADSAMYEVKRKGKNGYCYKNDDGSIVCKFFGTDF